MRLPTLQVLVYVPGKVGLVRTIPETLDAMQNLVGGYIKLARFHAPVVLVCNEEGLKLGLPKNRRGIRGTFFAVRVRGEKMVSLSGPEINATRTILEPYG